jgi:hypothetical protein
MNSRNASHGRVETARQKLVAQEEKYLLAHGWDHELYKGIWWWVWRDPSSDRRVLLNRTEAVVWQHTMGEV